MGTIKIVMPLPSTQKVALTPGFWAQAPKIVRVKDEVPTLAEARERWLQDRQYRMNRSEQTIFFYEKNSRCLLELVGRDEPVTSVQLEHIDYIVSTMTKLGKAPGYVGVVYRTLRAFMRWCGRRGWPVDSRLLLMEAPPDISNQKVAIFTKDELDRLHRAMVRPTLENRHAAVPLRNSLLFSLLLGTGVRLSELGRIELKDRTNDLLYVHSAKGGEDRKVPLSVRVRGEWDRYVRRVRPETDIPNLLLTDDGRTALQPHSVQTILQKAGTRAGIRHAHPHRFRHSFATLYCRRYIERGQTPDLERLRMLLGHTTLAMLRVYVHLAEQDLVRGWEDYAPY